MSCCVCFIVRGRALGIGLGGATNMVALWCCMCGRGLRGNNATCSTLSQLSVPSPTTHKQIGPFWCSFLGGWACVCSRTLGVSPSNSHVRLGVSPTATTPTGFFSQKFLRLYFPMLEPQVAWSVLLPSCSSWFICTQMWDFLFCQLLPCLLH